VGGGRPRPGTWPATTSPWCLTSSSANGGGHLFYSRRVNVLIGESGSGKSWVVLAAAVAAVILGGRHAVYVDLEDHPRSIVDRLAPWACRPR